MPYPDWTKKYAPGVRAEADRPPFEHFPQMLRSVAAQYGSKPAFSVCLPNGFSATLDYLELDALSDAFAAYLRLGLKLEQGDRVAVQLPNCLATPIAVYGVLKAGCVLVNTNPLYTVAEMQHQFKDSGAKALVIVDLFGDKVKPALEGTDVRHVILASVASFLPSWQKLLTGLVLKYVRKQVKACEVPHQSFSSALDVGRSALAAGADALSWSSRLGHASLAVLQYTGGTTGVAKGAMLSHGNLLWNIEELAELGTTEIHRGEEVLLVPLPLYHVFSFTVHLGLFYRCGCHNVLVPSPRPMSSLREPFKKFAVTWMTGVNTLYTALLHEQWFNADPPRCLRVPIAGGSALHTATADSWHKLLGSTILEGYGLTEASPVLCFNPLGAEVRVGTIGLPIPSTQVRLLSDAMQDVALGEPGELCAKGPQVMQGYWQRPDETAKVLIDGWLHTGDIAVMDADGYLKIVDRKKDMIIVSGFKVFPNEVEECIDAMEGVLESAVIGVPAGDTGEAVRAYVVCKEGVTLSIEQVRNHCKETLTSYKIPKQVRFAKDLPKSNIGKILRKDLKALALAEEAGKA
jgi:long-chain acyl-CoA synthetase